MLQDTFPRSWKSVIVLNSDCQYAHKTRKQARQTEYLKDFQWKMRISISRVFCCSS